MTKKALAEPEVLDVLEQEIALVKSDSTLIEKFATGLRAFFTRARALELTAQANLQKAHRLRAPTTMADDETLQFFIKRVGADRKEAIDHWEVTLQVSRFHKRLVAARKRSETPNDEAIEMATRLHNNYVENERRRVAAENERLRLEAEKQAAADRAAELKRLEDAALAAEEFGAAVNLSEREEQFVDLVTGRYAGNALEAARVAGYKDPLATGARLMLLPKIIAAIEAKRHAATIREQKAAVAAQPLDVQAETVNAQVSRAGGFDRTTHSAELVDERLLIEAVLGGKHGIPSDLLTINMTKLGEYARSLHELISRWPGVKYVRKTSLV